MPLAGLLAAVSRDPALLAVTQAAAQGLPTADVTAPAGLRPFAVAALAGARPVLAVTATARDAEDLLAALGSLLDPEIIAEFPAWETLPHERLSPRADTVGRRLAVLRRLAHPETTGRPPLAVVVAPVRSVLQPLVPGLGEVEPVQLQVGEAHDLEQVVTRLVELAYTRVDLVEKRGELAVRGGILDVFPPTDDHPVRIDFFGDDVEEIRHFAVADQRSIEGPDGIPPHGLFAPPCRELLLTDAVRARAKALQEAHPELLDILDPIADGRAVEGMEALAPVLAGTLTLLTDELPDGAVLLACDPERVRARAAELTATSQEFLEAGWSAAAVGAKAPLDLGAAAYRSWVDVREHALATGRRVYGISPFGTDLADDVDADSRASTAKAPEAYRGDLQQAVGDLKAQLDAGTAVVVVTEGHGPAQRIVELLRESDLGATYAEDLAAAPKPGVVTVTTGCLATGFRSDFLHLSVLTETDLAGQKGVAKDARMPTRRRKGIDPLALQPGDAVVHEQHGVGRYVEMVQRTVNGGQREYLVLEYAKGDRLFVPTDALEQVTRYVGGESPSLHRLGGGDWAKTKSRARKAVKEIAAELIRLYSARMASPGHAFGPDTPWQRELEDAFPYHETPDQSAAIDEVKHDMEQPVPMDRVICGDVGYGKTEIAVRAAFKAVMDGKQVAVLVPTTLLVNQHFATFSERFASFPVTVGAVSRFNSDAEQRDVLAKVADGGVDVVIGTHRLLSSSTRFNDLGLVIVDEEQRFGVEHKEYLKRVRTTVDVLTMSATPIPRTLEMSITGIREMSSILTPPEERHPVLTFVGPYDDKQVSAAIRRELLREGQVFYIHNRVESIERTARRLRELVPEARIATAHGQMNEDALEKVMLGFWEKDFDVLVCTTIVESGLDIANANTLLVERSDTFGLSQLHQLRGRVGRGRERAYAYFLFPPEKPMTELAHDRLATIAANTDLGAGMAVAMKDLEIRGAGNLLGGEQSGQIAAVGFDLYVRLVGEAVAEVKGTPAQDLAEVKVELPIDANLPHDYVNGERLRLDVYRRLATAGSSEALAEVRTELTDRFGPLPDPVQNLLAVAEFRQRARGYRISEVALAGRSIRFGGMELRESQSMRLTRLYRGAQIKPATNTVLIPAPTATGRLGSPPLRDVALLAWCAQVLDAVLGDSVPAAAASSRA